MRTTTLSTITVEMVPTTTIVHNSASSCGGASCGSGCGGGCGGGGGSCGGGSGCNGGGGK